VNTPKSPGVFIVSALGGNFAGFVHGFFMRELYAHPDIHREKVNPH